MRSTIFRAICAAALALGASFSLAAADAPGTWSPDSVYVKMDYMKLDDSTPRQYFELELGEWRDIQEQRIRNGVTTAWYFYEVMPGDHHDDQTYHYITVSVFDSYDKVFDEAGTEAIFDVYPGVELQELYDRADAARNFVRSDLWKLTGVTSAYTQSKPMSEYLVMDFFEAAPADADTHEMKDAIHRERIRRGALNSAARLALRNPEDEARDYSYATIEYFDSLLDLIEPLDVETIQAAHPEMPEYEAARVVDAREDAYKSQIWRLIDSIEASGLDME